MTEKELRAIVQQSMERNRLGDALMAEAIISLKGIQDVLWSIYNKIPEPQ